MKYVPLIMHEIELEFVRSRGPGGQHVNKTNSAALLRWSVQSSQMLHLETRQILMDKLENLMTIDGDILIRSDEFRDQNQNRQRCFEKLEEAIARALFIPKPRKATKPTRSSKEKKLKTKKHRSHVKSHRGKIKSWD